MGCEGATEGDDAVLVRATAATAGGGGRGAMPTPALSVAAAAAAAADAYLSGCPVGSVGNGAGFIVLVAGGPLAFVVGGVFSVANAGRGDLSCNDGLRAVTAGASGTFAF